MIVYLFIFCNFIFCDVNYSVIEADFKSGFLKKNALLVLQNAEEHLR